MTTPVPDPPDHSLGQYLTDARLAAGWSVRQLAELSQVPKSTISDLEKDAIDSPKAAVLGRIARTLEVNAADLFLLAGLPVPEESASLEVMLRTEYGLPPEAVTEAKRHIEQLLKKYDGDQDGRS